MLFKVGDFLVSRAHMECRRLWPGSSWRPLLLQVVEVLAQTCSAGIEQVHYRCRGASPVGVISSEYTLFNEIELAAAPTEPEPVEVEDNPFKRVRDRLVDLKERAEADKPAGPG